MAELPFLVVHGALVWKAGVTAVGGAGIWMAKRLRDRRSSKFVSRATKHYTSTATGLEPGPILVRGILRGGGAQSYEHTWLPVVHSRDTGAYLDIEGERIDFDGEIVVGCGSENRTSYWKPPIGAPTVVDPQAKRRGAQRLSLVHADEEVLVAGVLDRASTGDADYRDSAGGWKISPFPRQGAIGLVAKAHRARAMPVGPLRTVVTYGVGALIALASLRACGAIEEGKGSYGPDGIHHMTVAAAMPGTREDALLDLDRLYLDARTPEHVDQAIALRELRRGCGSAIDLMLDEGRPEEALAAARRCELPRRELDALVVLGRYDEAWASPALHAFGTADAVQMSAIATGHWTDAAVAADPCLEAFYSALATPGAPRPDALTNGGARCALLGSQLLPAAQRLAAADAITTDGEHDTRLAYALVDLDASSTPRTPGDLERAASDLITGDGEAPSATVWTSHDGDITPARAVYETYRGNFDKAQQIAGTMIKQTQDPAHGTAAKRFAAVIAMRAGRPVSPDWLLHDEDLASDSVFLDSDLGAAFTIARGNAPSLARGAYGLASAVDGNGALLHSESRELRLADGLKLLAVLPRVTTARDQADDFARALIGSSINPAQGPFVIIRAAAMRRDLARATSDADAVAMWQGVIDRQMAILADHQKLVGLLAR